MNVLPTIVRRGPSASDYSVAVTGVVRNGLVYGAQFHPEKSGSAGLRLLRAFAQI